jgi:hypothetical protein
MRVLLLVVCGLAASGCSRNRPPTQLSLVWKGESMPRPNPEVSAALRAAPVSLTVVDLRPNPAEVVFDERNALSIPSTVDVAQYTAGVVRSILEGGGARVDPTATTQISLQLEAWRVVEGGMFNGEARVRVQVLRGGALTLNDVYEGKSKRWGRTHSTDNMNEALTSALSGAMKRLLTDRQFATALGGSSEAGTAPQPPPVPVRSL